MMRKSDFLSKNRYTAPMHVGRFFILFFLWFYSLSLQAAQVTDVRILTDDNHTRLVFSLNAAVAYQTFVLAASPDKPARLVLDLPQSQLNATLPPVSANALLLSIRSGIRQGDDLRMVLDLKTSVQYKTYLLTPQQNQGYRLLVDLSHHQAITPAQTLVPAPIVAPDPAPTTHTRPSFVVAIDAGHGGNDPGAIGYSGTYEKDVTLAIAQKIFALLQNRPNIQAVMIREGDYFMRLRQRIELAREYQADVFVSIHADAYNKNLPAIRGSSVYILSQSGASSEAAKWLAEKENAADLLGGEGHVSLNDKDDMLAQVLLDLSLSGTLEASARLGQTVLRALASIGDLHRNKLQQADFTVLLSPDIPSILVETAFISNPHEEKQLNNVHYQGKMAAAIVNGIQSYLNQYAVH
jgi:N-acetylmuramoyl-L-alanine amidase